MHFLTLIFRNLFRRRIRSALTVCGVAVATGAVVSLVGVVRSFEQSMLSMYQERGVDVVVFRAAGIHRASATLDANLAQQIRQLPDVCDVSASLAETISFPDEGLFGVVLQGLPLDSFLLRRINVVAGRRIQPGDVRGVMLGKVIAQNLDKRVGDRLEVIEWEPYNVVGIFESFSFLENNIMIIDIREMQRLFGREDQVTGFVVASKCIERQSNDELCRRIKALSPLVDAQPTQEFIDTAVEVRMARSMVWLTSTVAVVVATIGTLNTMVMAVHERTQEIALLRAMGWRKSRVVKMILGESLLIGLGGAALGTLLAIGLMQLLSRQRMVEHLVPAEIAPAVVAQAFAIATIVCVLSGVYPACRAAKLSAAEGLRHE